MPRDRCVYCKKFFNNTREEVVDNWDRLCEWCVADFEGVDYIFPPNYKERSSR